MLTKTGKFNHLKTICLIKIGEVFLLDQSRVYKFNPLQISDIKVI